MAKPSKKSAKVTSMLDKLAGRRNSIYSNRCVAEPFGCGGPAESFRDELSKKEYSISGLCQYCQDQVFG